MNWKLLIAGSGLCIAAGAAMFANPALGIGLFMAGVALIVEA